MTDGKPQTRVELLSERDRLDSSQQEVFDEIAASRGDVLRPFHVLLHIPGIARPTASLGHQIRFVGELSDHDRELAIITTARCHNCDFEWQSHVGLARNAGVPEDVIAAVDSGGAVPGERAKVVVDYVRELCATSTVSDHTHAGACGVLGAKQVVELSALVGYYTLLGFVMNAAAAG